MTEHFAFSLYNKAFELPNLLKTYVYVLAV